VNEWSGLKIEKVSGLFGKISALFSLASLFLKNVDQRLVRSSALELPRWASSFSPTCAAIDLNIDGHVYKRFLANKAS